MNLNRRCPVLERCLIMQGMTQIINQPLQAACFSCHINLNRVKDQSIHTIWSYTIDQNRLKLKVAPNSSDKENLSSLLCDEFKTHSKQIQSYISFLMNQFASQLSELKYYISPHDGAIVVQSRMTKYIFITTQINLQNYFNRQINLLKTQIIDLIQNVSFYFEIFPFKITDAEIAEPLNIKSHLQLKKKMIDLFRLENFYETNPNNQDVPKNQNQLRIQQFKHKNCIDILFGQKQLQAYIQSLKTPGVSTQSVYRFEHKKLLESFTKKSRLQNQFVTSIKILKSQRIQNINSGSFGQIKKGLFNYITQISMFGHSSTPQDSQKSSQNNSQPSALSSVLVIKEGKKILKVPESKSPNPSFDIETKFLTYMRNKKCRSFAKYFCNIGMEPFSDGNIYLQYYPQNFSNSNLCQLRKAKVIEDICVGLSFLYGENIIHRDLKPANIMLDRSGRGKIIDFGSIGTLKYIKDLEEVEKEKVVRSTPGYFIPHQKAIAQCKRVSLNPYYYYFHDRYDLYSLGVILQEQFDLENYTGYNNFFRNSLKLLSNKCKLVNPNDRWSVHQVTIYMIRLFKFYLHRENFWKFEMTDGLSAYDFCQSEQN